MTADDAGTSTPGHWIKLPARATRNGSTIVRQPTENRENRRFCKPARTSRGQATYKCPNCGRHYMRNSCLKRHLRVECGKAPEYQCNMCQSWFKYKHALTEHLKLHLEEPKFQCELCFRKFYRRDKLAKHRKELHKNIFRA
ncbi:uncharacterized protein LOC144473360 [Augochlora pura]